MSRWAVVAALLVLPSLSKAGAAEASLLGGQALAFSPLHTQSRLGLTLRLDSEATTASPGPVALEPPSLASIIVLMAVGGELLVQGVVFLVLSGVYVAAAFAAGALGLPADATRAMQISYYAVGGVCLTAGIASLAVGVPLFVSGNGKRTKRRESLQTSHRISFGYDPGARSPAIGYAFSF